MSLRFCCECDWADVGIEADPDAPDYAGIEAAVTPEGIQLGARYQLETTAQLYLFLQGVRVLEVALGQNAEGERISEEEIEEGASSEAVAFRIGNRVAKRVRNQIMPLVPTDDRRRGSSVSELRIPTRSDEEWSWLLPATVGAIRWAWQYDEPLPPPHPTMTAALLEAAYQTLQGLTHMADRCHGRAVDGEDGVEQVVQAGLHHSVFAMYGLLPQSLREQAEQIAEVEASDLD
jgi:hypothetical protein